MPGIDPDRARHDLFPAPPTAGILPGSQAADTIGVNAMSDELLTAGRIAELLGGTVEGSPSVAIKSIAAIDLAGPDDVTFAGDDRRVAQLANSRAGAAIVAASARTQDAPMPLIRVQDVNVAVAKLLERMSRQEDLPPVGVDPGATIADNAQLGPEVRIGPGVVVGPGAKIGPGSALLANVSVGSDVEIGRDAVICEGVAIRRGCRIGHRVRIGPNSVVGYDGFGYYFADGTHHKIPHIGNVVIEDDVEIGACSCIDRAKFGSTRIAAGAKIDNLVQIAHNVQVGRGCILASLSGVAGSSSLGQFVVLGGHVGIRDNIKLGNGVTCAAYTAVAEDVPDGLTMFGIPAIPARDKFREISLVRKLPELVKRVGELEKRLEALDSSEDH